MGSVVVLGSLNQDLVLRVERHPAPGETVRGDGLEARPGGKGANQAVAAARAGAPCELVGRVGDDAAGHGYLERLRAWGVGTADLVVTAGAATGTAVVCVDAAGENTIVVAPGANALVGADDLGRLERLGPGDVLLAQLELPVDVVVEAVARAAARGARVVLNLAPYADLPAETLAVADPVVVNEHEAGLLAASGATAGSLLVTRGARGSRWGGLDVPAAAVVPIDTTGAGDSFCGTLAARLCLGDDPAQAVRAATDAAAATVQHVGAQPDPPG